MSYQALYRKYRPNNFEEVVGQDYIVKTIQNAIKNNCLSHAYLFCGPRGTGKTSVAKLFAKALNCPFEQDPKVYNNHPDLYELDAASNNSVEDIRNIIDTVQYAPIQGQYKIYIIDEVHMLSNSAFNALLKTLEEPPENVVFILATTDPQKILETVLSRVQRFDFRLIDQTTMIKKMAEILDNEKVSYDQEVLQAISELAQGGMRDCLSILDQLIVFSSNKLSQKHLNEAYGLISKQLKIELVNDCLDHNQNALLTKARHYVSSGINLKILTSDILKIYKDIYIYLASANPDNLTYLTETEINTLKLDSIDLEVLLDKIDIIIETLQRYKVGQNINDLFELCLIKLAKKDINNYIVVNQETAKNAFKTFNSIEINTDILMRIMHQSTKEEKSIVTAKLSNLEQFKYEPNYRKFYLALKESPVLLVSSEALVVVNNSLEINEVSFNKELYNFLKNKLDIDKMIYVVSENQKNELLRLYKSGLNPTKEVKIEKYQIKEDKVEDRIENYFDNVEIIKE